MTPFFCFSEKIKGFAVRIFSHCKAARAGEKPRDTQKSTPCLGCSRVDNFVVAEFLPRGRAVRSQGDPRENVSPCRSPLCGSRRRKATSHHKKAPRYGVPFYGDSWQNRTAVSALRGPCLSRLTNEPFFACKLL